MTRTVAYAVVNAKVKSPWITVKSVQTTIWFVNTAQLPRYVGMLIKSFQVFYYIFLVVPSLDFMLEVKSSQKLMVHISPYGSHIKWL